MRELADVRRIRQFMRALGAAARGPGRVYLTGGATAVLAGWRASTIDIDLKLVPDDDALMRAIPALKESLQVNVELAAPIDLNPESLGSASFGDASTPSLKRFKRRVRCRIKAPVAPAPCERQIAGLQQMVRDH
jgi:hypothetical protein